MNIFFSHNRLKTVKRMAPWTWIHALGFSQQRVDDYWSLEYSQTYEGCKLGQKCHNSEVWIWVSCVTAARLGSRVPDSLSPLWCSWGGESLILTAPAALYITCSWQSCVWTKLELEHSRKWAFSLLPTLCCHLEFSNICLSPQGLTQQA